MVIKSTRFISINMERKFLSKTQKIYMLGSKAQAAIGDGILERQQHRTKEDKHKFPEACSWGGREGKEGGRAGVSSVEALALVRPGQEDMRSCQCGLSKANYSG